MEGLRHDIYKLNTLLSDINPIEEGGLPVNTKEDLERLVEPPLLEACQRLFEKGIKTVFSSANRKDVQLGYAHIALDFDSLSPKNQEIALRLGVEGKIHGAVPKRGIYLRIPVDTQTTFGLVRAKALDLVEQFEDQEREVATQSDQELLEDGLLSGSISPEQFLEKVRALDQSTPSRDDAVRNALLLRDVKDFFVADTEHRDEYFNLLSLTYFHIGQQTALEGSPDALRYFEYALVAAHEIAAADFDEWRSYIDGTIAYLKNDLEGVKAAALKLDAGRNREILENYIKGLEERGHADYGVDYAR